MLLTSWPVVAKAVMAQRPRVLDFHRPKCSLRIWVPQTHRLGRNTEVRFLFRLTYVSLTTPNEKLPCALLQRGAE